MFNDIANAKITLNDYDKNVYDVYNMFKNGKQNDAINQFFAQDTQTVLEHNDWKNKYNNAELFLIRAKYAFKGNMTPNLFHKDKLKKLAKYSDFTAILNNPRFEITNKNFYDILAAEKDNTKAFLYCDPPYLTTSCKEYNEQLFRSGDFLYLLDALETHKCKIMLNLDMTPYVFIKYAKYIKTHYQINFNSWNEGAKTEKNINRKILGGYQCILTNF